MNELTDMEIFARVVSANGMSAAGREMGLSPAVISKRIRRLEARLGARLLQRTTRQITLTEEGQGYYERVVGILASIEDAEAFVARSNEVPSGTLRVTAPTSFGRMHIAPHLGHFQDHYPAVRICLMLTDEFIDIVGDGFDLAIRIAALESSSLIARRLAPSQRIICAAPSYLERRGEPQTLSDLAQHDCLFATHQDVWQLEGPDGPIAQRVTGSLQTNSSEVVREAAIAGLGIALRSTWDVGDALKEGKLRIVLPQYRECRLVGLYAIYPSRSFLPAKVRTFIDFLAELYGPEPYWDEGLDLTTALHREVAA